MTLTKTTKTLAELEAVVDRFVSSGMQAAGALTEIRDRKLYKETHETFEDYCQKKWGYCRQYVYNLIDAHEVKEELSTIVYKIPEAKQITSEGQLRVLVDVEETYLKPVVERAVEIADGEPITAKVLQKAKSEILKTDKPLPPRRLEPEERAKAAIPDLLRQIRFHLGNLEIIDRWGQLLDDLESEVEDA